MKTKTKVFKHNEDKKINETIENAKISQWQFRTKIKRKMSNLSQFGSVLNYEFVTKNN